jgi:DNA-binding transcriptional ArsR family regulator
MTALSATDDLAVARGAALFNGLGDRSRLAIVRALASGEHRVTDLVGMLGLAQGTVSGHLACLRDCGLVRPRAQGRQMFYSLAHPQLLDLLTAAEALLALTGEAVELCPNYGPTAKKATR